MNIIIIGNGITGITCARNIRKKNSDATITVISEESKHFYSRTALMYIYMGQMKYENTKPYEDWFWSKNRINLIQATVNRLNTENKSLQLDDSRILNYDKLVLATGGIGGLFEKSTNQEIATSDGVFIANKLGATIENLSFIQFHPTVLWRDLANRGQQPLISEAVRGEGAILLNAKNEQFMVGKHPQADLAPRDVVAIEIFNQMRLSGQPYVWLDATRIKDFANRFPTIYASCMQNGIDPTKEKIPVAPASHYASGGVLVDLNGKSSIDGLYICGESACTGAHGANRLASNSLLEGLVFGARIAAALSKELPAQQEAIDDQKSVLLDPKILLPLQIAMSEGAGVLRSEASLTKTLQTLGELSKLTSTEPCIEAWEATNLHLLATVIVKSALQRTESRGSHWRSDYPDSEVKWLSRIIQQIDSSGNWKNQLEVI